MTTPLQAANQYFDAINVVTEAIRATQIDALTHAAEQCAASIAAGGLAHLFGTGHSRIPLEEMFPRHGSYPGFHPIAELSMTFHTQVVGANGQRQAMFIERVEGLGEVILQNFTFGAHDCMMIFSHSGVNAVVIDVALGAQRRGMPVISVVSVDHCAASAPKHSSGKRLTDVSDIVIDTCVPKGDALVHIDDLDYPVGPGSTIAYAYIVNTIKSMVAADLTNRGMPPLVLTSGVLIGAEASADVFDRAYNEYRRRIGQLYR